MDGVPIIDIDIAPYLFSVNFLTAWVVSWHGFFSFIAVGVSVVLVGRWAPLKGVDPDTIYSIAIWAIIGGIVGARIVHVADHWTDIYRDSPGQIINIARGGIAVWGGILGGFIAGSAYALWAKHPVGLIADLTAPVLLLAQTIGRLGDIINGEHCAKATEFFLGFTWTHPETSARVACPNQYFSAAGDPISAVHPVIAYEMAWNMIALAIVWRLRGRLMPDGMVFALYLALYAVGRFAITFMRDDKVWAFGMQEAHYISLLVLAITVPLLSLRARFIEPVEEVPAVFERGSRAERRRRNRRG